MHICGYFGTKALTIKGPHRGDEVITVSSAKAGQGKDESLKLQ